jgi:hypothetical protein
MNGISTANSINVQRSEWCYGTKTFEEVAKENRKASATFTFPAERSPAADDEIQLKRFAAFGRSFTEASWS